MRSLEAVAAETGVDLKTVQAVAAALSQVGPRDPELVTLRHQALPAEQVIQVHRDRIGPRLAAGWEAVETPVADPAPETNQGAETDATEPEKPDVEPDRPKRQRRTNTEEL